MRKNLNKLIAIGMALNISAGCIPALAVNSTISDNKVNLADSTAVIYENLQSKPVILCDTLVEKAKENSAKLALKSKEISMYKKKMNTQKDLNDEIGVSELGTLKSDYSEYFLERTGDYYVDSYKININAAKQDKEFMEDKIARDIRDKYEEIVLMEIEVGKIKRELEVSSNTSKYAEVNVQTGYGTENTKLASDIAVKKLKNELSAKEDLLKNKKDYLGVLTDTDLSKYSFDYNLTYAPITISDSDSYFDSKIDEYLKYKVQLLDLSEDYSDDLKDNIDDSPSEPTAPAKPDFTAITKLLNSDITAIGTPEGQEMLKKQSQKLKAQSEEYLKYTKEYIKYVQELNSYLKYLEIDYNVAANNAELDDSRKLMKSKLEEAYSSLKDLENQIDLMNDQFKYVNNNLLYAKVQKDTGMMTVNDYNDKVTQAEDLEIGLRQLVNGYNKLKDVIEKPWCSIG